MERTNLQNCLKSVIDNRGVTPHKRNTEWQVSGIPVYSANNVKTSGIVKKEDIRYVPEEVYDSWMKEPLEKGDLLLTSEAPAGEVYYWDSDEKIIVGQRLYGLKVKNNVNAKYLKYYLQSPIGQKAIQSQQSGSTVFGISAKTFPNIVVNLPEKKEQDKIGNVLYSLDKKIDNNNKISLELESIIRTIYDYWFLQFEFPNKDGKPYKSSGGKMVYNEKLKRKIPVGWEVEPLRNKFEIKRGISYTSDEIKNNKGVPMLNLACIDINRNYRDGELKYYSGKIDSSSFLDEGDMLIATTDLTRNADIVGCPILTPFDGTKYTYTMDLAKFTLIDNKLNKWYIYQTLRTDMYHDYIKKWASGTNVLHLNLDGINWYNIMIPDKKVQDEYSELVKRIVNMQSKLIKENQQLAELRDFLLPMLINGQVKIES